MRQRLLTDTSPEAEQVLARIHRDMPFERKWKQMGELYQTARIFHASRVLAQNPQATPEEIRDDWMRTTLGEELYRTVQEARNGVHD